MKEHYDVVVIGAGVVGSAIAYYAARAGLHIALIDKGPIAGEASQAGAGMLAPLADHPSELSHPFSQLCLAGLRCYQELDQELKHETGIDIELLKIPTLRPAFDEQRAATYQDIIAAQEGQLPGLRWLERTEALEVEPLLPKTIVGAMLSPAEHSVQVKRLTLAFVQGALRSHAQVFARRTARQLIFQNGRIVGISTDQGDLYAPAIVLAAGAWATTWHVPTTTPPIFPVKGQMLALQLTPGLHLKHTLYASGIGCILPKADGSVYVGSTKEHAGFDTHPTAEGLSTLLQVVTTLAPQLLHAPFVRTWAGLRPASADELPLIGPSQSTPGLWVAGGHYRDGILLGPVTGQILAALLQKKPVPFDLDLSAYDPDRFGGWSPMPA